MTLDTAHRAITPETHPLFCTLCETGPCGLMQQAVESHGFIPSADGYISKCDLCYTVRRRLHESGDSRELQPANDYTG